MFRLTVRIKVFRQLFADDYFVIAACAMSLANAILWQTQQTRLYDLIRLQFGKTLYTPSAEAYSLLFNKYVIAFNILFYSSLWAVKLSFLLFFRRLDKSVRRKRYWWWFVLVVTVGSWAGCVGDIQWDCTLGSDEYIASK